MKNKHDNYVTKGGIKINKYLYLCLVVALFVIIGILKFAGSSSGENNSSNVETSSVNEKVVYSSAPEKTAQAASTTAETKEDVKEVDVKTYRFRTDKQAKEHFEKHGGEFPYSSLEEYVAGANKVINDSSALTKTEKEDGDYVYYLEKTNEFVIVSTDGYLRTYFKPSAGKAYYDRQ